MVGIFLAAAVAGHTFLALGFILLCVFMAFYAFQQAYGLMIFWITLIIALLYGLLGSFQPSLLVLRLEETAIGSAIGIAVTMFVLPIRSRDTFRGAVKEFLKSLSNVVKQASSEAREERLGATQEVQSKAQTLRNSIGPLKRGWAQFSSPSQRRAAHVAMYCAFLSRQLAHQGGVSEAETSAIVEQIDKLNAELDDHGPQPEDASRDRDRHRDISEEDASKQGVSGPQREALEQAGPVPRALRDALSRFGEALQDV